MQLVFQVGKRGATAVRVAPLQISQCAKETHKQLSVMALRLWVQRPNIRALLPLLQHGLEQVPERLLAI